jgi:hypothetical protein
VSHRPELLPLLAGIIELVPQANIELERAEWLAA